MIGGGAHEGQPQRDVHRRPERGHLDRRHPHVVVGREDGVELAAHRPNEHGVGGDRAGGTEALDRGRQDPGLLVTEKPLLAGMRVEGAEGEPRLRDAEPLLQRPPGDLAGPDNPVGDAVTFRTLNAYFTSIGGGTDQIQRNIVGERVLGLPKEPDPYKDTPFRDLPSGGS